MCSSSAEDTVDLTLTEISNETTEARDSHLPAKSREKYLLVYENFIQWKNSKNIESFSEDVFLEYFNELGVKYKPNSLWCVYSMLKSTVKSKHDIDMKTYYNLLAFLKKRSGGYVCRTSKVLTTKDVEKFLKEAPDYQYLVTKVALIFGVTGACSRQDLCAIRTKDVETHGDILVVKISNANNKLPRSFTVQGPFYDLVKKYEALRSKNASCDRFFLNYQKGKCTAQPIGINKFGAMPKEIAKYLKLPDYNGYTGHSFRRTSASLLADSGTDILSLKRHCGWPSDAVAKILSLKRRRTKSDAVAESDHEEERTSPHIPQVVSVETKEFKPERSSSPETNDSKYPPPTSTATSTSTSITNIHHSFKTFQDMSFTRTLIDGDETGSVPKVVHYHFNNCTFNNCFND